MSAVIETADLTRRYDELVAVDGVNLEVEEGEVFGLLGPNGAGKTTVIKMLTTLLEPTSGRAWVGGFDVQRQAMKVRHIIGYVPQLVSADATLTGYENLLIFARLYEVPRSQREIRIAEALDEMHLAEAAHRLVKTYSGGMIRRLEIAQSMLHTPQVLFLDEPTVGLDPLARRSVWERLEGLRSRLGTTIFLTTHDMEEADDHCGRIAIMHLGKRVALGSPAELKLSTGIADASLEDVFEHFAATTVETGGDFLGTSRTRRVARRLG